MPVLYYGRRAVKTQELVSVCMCACVSECACVCFGELGVLPREFTQKLRWVQHMDEFGRGVYLHLMGQTVKFYTFT
jgi:hypothetical protein